MSTQGNQQHACPRCGRQLDPEGMHICTSLVPPPGESPSVAVPTDIRLLADEEPRMVSCPHCQKWVDVTRHNPLDVISCEQCHHSFELLRNFGEFLLLKSYPTSWRHAVYLAQHLETGELTLIKILSAHVLGQPEALEEFHRECDHIHQLCHIDLVKSVQTGHVSGFSYLAVILQAGVSDDAVLVATGMDLDLERSPTVSASLQLRYTTCPKCGNSHDVTRKNPLDTLTCPSCGKQIELHRNLGPFRLDYKLNVGGSSVLYLAEAHHLKKKVALKILSADEMIRNPQSIPMFEKEAELTRQLSHPNIVNVYEHGELQGFHYMALELIDGLTLDDILNVIQTSQLPNKSKDLVGSWEFDGNKDRFRPALPESICLEIMMQAAAGLGAAHERGLIHGDVKPENIMVTYQGIVKILDFGLVQFANAEKLIQEGDPIMGTPLYIPPERVRGENEDFRSDLYSLGATLYHLLRGIAPFVAKNAADMAMKHARSPLVKFKAYAPWVSDLTCNLVERSLRKNVQERYGSHIEFTADLALARNQLMQTTGNQKEDGRTALRKFMRSLPKPKRSISQWIRARSENFMQTYQYVTTAITSRVRSKGGS